ncbi:hypothetical protein SUGI_0198880 [Cryptomeria japonica]|nr:hypothetical protein SUGI_0198880 [Cryptomeria japonica]
MAASGRPKAKPRFDPSILNQAKSKSCDAVMEETEKAITAVEYAQASFCLEGVLFTYNAEEADRAYRSACAAIARGDFDLGNCAFGRGRICPREKNVEYPLVFSWAFFLKVNFCRMTLALFMSWILMICLLTPINEFSFLECSRLWRSSHFFFSRW